MSEDELGDLIVRTHHEVEVVLTKLKSIHGVTADPQEIMQLHHEQTEFTVRGEYRFHY